MGEVISLKVSDLNLGSREVKISRASVMVAGELIEDLPKSGKTRKVPLTRPLVEKLRAYTAEMRRPVGSFKVWTVHRFLRMLTGTYLKPQRLQSVVRI